MELNLPEMEQKWREFWERNDVYRYSPQRGKPSFSIDTPPPTVSGDIHMGHGFGYVHQDIIARYKRMKGFDVFYPMGFDNNGLPTEKFAEKIFGKRSNKVPREEFLEMCNTARKEGRAKIMEVFRLLGLSADLNNPYESNSTESRRITQSLFLDLIKKERAYREKGAVTICPTCMTAISQIDMKDMERTTEFYYVSFGDIGENKLEIATTRPEMISACVALCVNPEDERYKTLIGKSATVPIYSHSVPVISDPYVDMEKGTGMEMICTFGDQNDVDLWKKHSLDTRIVIDLYGRMIGDQVIPEGSLSTDARKKIISKLKEDGLLLKSERKKQNVNVHERCDTPLEIGISNQWFIRYLDLKEELLKQGRKVTWYPEFMHVRYENWVNGLKYDWCISRQRISGIPFPVWYCRNCGEMVLADEKDLPVDPRETVYPGKCVKCGSNQFDPDTDVMDTWATSSISPRLAQIPKGIFPELYPMDIRFQGHDIIVAWAFTTIVRSLIHDNKLPWNGVYVNGMVRTSKGLKMSKSRGTGYTPIDFINEYGTDALRHWTTVASNGEDLVVSEKDLRRGRRTVIKIMNAANLVRELTDGTISPETGSGIAEQWVLSKLKETVKSATNFLDKYDISHARALVDNFFWNVFCDRYLELCKPRIRSETIPESEKEMIRNTLLLVFDSILKMYAPVMPFITEELYHTIRDRKEDSIHLENWPEVDWNTDSHKVDDMEYVVELIDSARSTLSNSRNKESGNVTKDIIISGRKELVEDSLQMIEGMTRSRVIEIRESSDTTIQIIN